MNKLLVLALSAHLSTSADPRPALVWMHLPVKDNLTKEVWERAYDGVMKLKDTYWSTVNVGLSLYRGHVEGSSRAGQECFEEIFNFDTPLDEKIKLIDSITPTYQWADQGDPMSAFPLIANEKFPPLKEGDDTVRMIFIYSDKAEPQYDHSKLQTDSEEATYDQTCGQPEKYSIAQYMKPLHDAQISITIAVDKDSATGVGNWYSVFRDGQMGDSFAIMYQTNLATRSDSYGSYLNTWYQKFALLDIAPWHVSTTTTTTTTTTPTTTASTTTTTASTTTTTATTPTTTASTTTTTASTTTTTATTSTTTTTPTTTAGTTTTTGSSQKSSSPMGGIAGASVAGVALLGGLAYSIFRPRSPALDVGEQELTDADGTNQLDRDSAVRLNEAAFSA